MSVFIAIPHTRAAEWEFVESLAGMIKTDPLDTLCRLPGQKIDHARNLLILTYFQDPGKQDYMMFIDSDATWEPGSIARMVSRGVPMVTAINYRRGIPPVPVLGPFNGLDPRGHHTYHFGKTIEALYSYLRRYNLEDLDHPAPHLLFPDHGADNDLLPIDGCGMHFCLIRRDVFTRIPPIWFREYGSGAGEDLYFCRKVRAAGIPIYADLSVHTGHIAGPGVVLGLADMLKYYTGGSLEEAIREEVWAV